MPGSNGDFPIAIDPPGCGCTECSNHEYVPVDDPRVEDAFEALADGVIEKLHSHNSASYAVWRGGDGKVHHEEFFCPTGSFIVQDLWDLRNAIALIYRGDWGNLEIIELKHCEDEADVKFALQDEMR